MKKKDMKKSDSQDNKTRQSKVLEIELMDNAINMLMDEYGYPKERIKIRYPLKISVIDSKEVPKTTLQDIVVLDQDNNEEILLDVKSSIKQLYTETNTGKLIFNLLGTNAKYGILFNGEEKYCFKKVLGTQVIEIPDIPTSEFKKFKSQDFDKVIKFENYFFRTFTLLRKEIPADYYSITLIQVLFAKYVDEKLFAGKNLSNCNPDTVKEEIQNLLNEGERNFKISLHGNNTFEGISKPTLFSIIQETNYFSILNSNPESMIKEIFKIMDNYSSMKKRSLLTVPESVSLLMYKFIVNGATAQNIKERKLLLTHVGEGKIVFDVLQHISEEFEIIGKNLQEFSDNITILERVKEKSEILKFLLLLKNFESVKIFNEEPMLFSKNSQFGGVIGFPPIGSELKIKEIEMDKKLGSDYISNYIIQMSENVKPSGYFTLVVSGGYLFSERSRKSRNMVLENNILRGIIQFPPGTFLETMVPPVVLFLQKKPETKTIVNDYNVFISDLSKQSFISKNKLSPKIIHDVWENFMELQEINKIIEEEDTCFSININELIQSENWNLARIRPSTKKIAHIEGKLFEEFVEIIHPISRSAIKQNEQTIEIPEIRISDIIKEGFINEKIEKHVKVSKSILDSNNSLQENDIIFSTKGTIGKFGLINAKSKNSVINTNLIIIRSKHEVSKILYILGTDYFQNQLKNNTNGFTIKYIRIKDLKSIIIPNYLLKETTMKKMEHFQEEILVIRKELDSKLEEFEKFRSDLKNG